MKLIASILIGIGLLSAVANAAVLDSVVCTISLKDLGTGIKTQNSTEFEIARRPLSASPSPDIRLYAGDFKSVLVSNQGDFKLSVDYRLVSKYATKNLGSQGWDARHSVCALVGYSVCSNNSCYSISSECLTSEDPFAANIGWPKVELINGIPQFDALQLPTNTGGKIIYGNGERDVTEYLLQCAYKGTLD